MHILPVLKERNTLLPFVEIAGNKSGYGLMCHDDMDVTAAEIICRSLSKPAFLDTYKQGSHSAYTGKITV